MPTRSRGRSSPPPPRVPPARSRGVAIVTVLLVVALAATLAASVAWRELVALHDVSNQRLGVETMWAERAAVEWARVMLRDQARKSNVAYVGQSWSNPVDDVRISGFLPEDALRVNSDLADAYVSGSIEDAQSKFNVMDLVSRPAPSAPWQINQNGVEAYRRLLTHVSLDPALAEQTAKYMLRSLGAAGGTGNGDQGFSTGGSGNSWPLQLVTVADLARIPGYGAQSVKVLSDFVTLLPDFTNVNVNTASETAIIAAIPTLSESQALMLTQRRSSAYFVSGGDVALVLSPQAGASLPSGALVDVTSNYFLVHCRIHSAKINTRIDTLIARHGIGNFAWTTVVWAHRIAA
ncbi:type II secretion system minor pseudopilin GspK [Pararobbsia alpina]|uniref:type II secretion system minor pseudopilin GspK n=1 Tax=Pararobbsia alpina TaxID=621374 RepID=UPI0039A426C4